MATIPRTRRRVTQYSPAHAESAVVPNQLQAILEELIDDRGFTRSGLARRAGLHRNTVTAMLNPKKEFTKQRPDSDTLEKLAAALGVPAKLLFDAASSTAGYRPHTVERRSNHRARVFLALLEDASEEDAEEALAAAEFILERRRLAKEPQAE